MWHTSAHSNIPRPFQVNPIADEPATLLNGPRVIAPSAHAAEAAIIRDAFKGDGRVTIRLVPSTGAVNGLDVADDMCEAAGALFRRCTLASREEFEQEGNNPVLNGCLFQRRSTAVK